LACVWDWQLTCTNRYRAKAAGGEERLFARALVRKPEVFASGGNQDKSLVDLLLAESERVLVDAMHAIEVQVQASGNGHARAEADGTAKYNHHIFLKILPEAVYVSYLTCIFCFVF
jgi:hypothetical protein